MSEQLRGEEVHFPDAPQTEAEHEAYYADAIEKIKNGQTTWVQRSFDADSGRVLDLFSDKQYRGYIEQEYDDMACDVYLVPSDDPAGEARRINYQRVSVAYAASLLLSAIEAPDTAPTSSGFGYRGH